MFECSALLLASYIAVGTPIPPATDRGFWFYAALLAVTFGARLDTPHFTTPADTILYAVPALIALLLASQWDVWGQLNRTIFATAALACFLTVLIAFAAILTNGSSKASIQRLSNALRIVCEFIGSPRAIFSVVLLSAIALFHRNSARETLVIVAAWGLTVALSPLERGVLLLRRVRRALRGITIGVEEGEIVAHQLPRLLLIRTRRDSAARPGALLLANDPIAGVKLVLAVDYVGRDEGVLLRALEIDRVHRDVADMDDYPPNAVVVAPELVTGSSDADVVKRRAELVGVVAPETSLERLYFEVTRDDELQEGLLVETRVGTQCVTYQVVNGLTREEVVHHKNTYGFARGQAQRIGIWRADAEKFVPAKWIPRANEPVFLRAPQEAPVRQDAIGSFPGTAYPLRLSDINALVTHNTAILGILGVGKSSLALELVERMVAEGVKVIVLDLTNQYATELHPYFDADREARAVEVIQAAGDRDRAAVAENPEEGGSIVNIVDAIREDLRVFLAADDAPVKIYNPARITGTKQVSEPRSVQAAGQWRRAAALWSISPVEVARIVTEATLELLQDEMSDRARACIVFEEAHSLIPEWNSVASDGDRIATNATARAILQGRKYGFGCVVVTQRTASVTKTILNQCNTVFAMRIFDETGKDFLANYVGRDYASALPSLPERHAVLFGKASSCENPVVIRLNDRQEFIRVFRPDVDPG
jgi:hypothetical protein